MSTITPADVAQHSVRGESETWMVPTLAFELFRTFIDPPATDVLEFLDRGRQILPNLDHCLGSRGWKRLSAAALNRFQLFAQEPRPDGYHSLTLSDAKNGAPSSIIDCALFNTVDPTPEAERAELPFYRKRYKQRGAAWRPINVSLRLTLPLAHTMARTPALFRDWILELGVMQHPFVCAHCGYALNQNLDDPQLQFNSGRAVFRQHPGFDLAIAGGYLTLLKFRPESDSFLPLIKRVGWLTGLSSEAFPELGGLETLRARLLSMDGIELFELPHGLLVQAGPAPSVGNPARGDDLPWYRHVAQVLEPVRMPFFWSATQNPIEMEWLNSLDEEEP